MVQKAELQTYDTTNCLMQVGGIFLLSVGGEGASLALVEAADASRVPTGADEDEAAMTMIECWREAVVAWDGL